MNPHQEAATLQLFVDKYKNKSYTDILRMTLNPPPSEFQHYEEQLLRAIRTEKFDLSRGQLSSMENVVSALIKSECKATDHLLDIYNRIQDAKRTL